MFFISLWARCSLTGSDVGHDHQIMVYLCLSIRLPNFEHPLTQLANNGHRNGLKTPTLYLILLYLGWDTHEEILKTKFATLNANKLNKQNTGFSSRISISNAKDLSRLCLD